MSHPEEMSVAILDNRKSRTGETGPVRSCLGCAGMRPKEDLIRMVVQPGNGIAFDIGRSLPGRGSYVCPDRACLKLALQPKKLRRAFQKEVEPPSEEDSLTLLQEELHRRILGLLGMSRRAGFLVAGREAVLKAIGEERAELLVMAGDLSERTLSDLRSRKGRTALMVLGSTGSLGSAIGYPGRGIMTVTDPAMSRAILEYYKKLISLNLVIRGG